MGKTQFLWNICSHSHYQCFQVSHLFGSKCIFLFLNTIYFVLETFSDKRFAWNHFGAFFSSVFASSIRLAMSGNDFKKLVSSAKRLVKKMLHRGKSFIQSRNSRGPRTALPWGTPHVIIFSVEKAPFIHTYWVLLTI